MYGYSTIFFLLLLVELCTLQAAARGIRRGTSYYHKGSDGLYYNFHHEKVDWDKAQAKCKQESAHLAHISTPATFDYVKDTFKFHMDGIWMGGRDMNVSGDWRWMDQTPIEKKYWASGKPDHSKAKQEDCVMMNFAKEAGHLHDASCRWMGPKFLCQKEHRSCVKEKGSCVTRDGEDVHSIKRKDVVGDVKKCLQDCLAYPNVTGCWVGEGVNKYACYVTTQENVTKGNGAKEGECWIISKCEGTGPLPPPPPELPSGYIKRDKGPSYKLYLHELNFDTAKLKCHEDGAQLAIDDSKHGHAYILRTFPGQEYWVGVSDLEQKGIWKYEDGQAMKETFWDGGRPRGREQCVLMWHNGRWRDEACSSARSFLCEKQGMFVKDANKGDANSLMLPLIILAVVCVMVLIALGVFCKCRRSDSPDSSDDAHDKGVSNEGMARTEGGAPIAPLRPGMNGGGDVAVITDPSQYEDDMYAQNNEGPPSYNHQASQL